MSGTIRGQSSLWMDLLCNPPSQSHPPLCWEVIWSASCPSCGSGPSSWLTRTPCGQYQMVARVWGRLGGGQARQLLTVSVGKPRGSGCRQLEPCQCPLPASPLRSPGDLLRPGLNGVHSSLRTQNKDVCGSVPCAGASHALCFAGSAAVSVLPSF